MKTLIPCIVTAASLFALPLSAQQTIEEIAPRSTFLIMGADDMSRSVESFKASNVWAMLQAPELKEAADEPFNQLQMMVKQMEEQLGLEPGELQWPSGPMGMAFYMSMDEEIGLDVPGMIALANFGDHEEMLQTILDSIVEELENSDVSWHEDELRGRTVIVVDTQEDEIEFGDIDMEDPDEPAPPGDLPMGRGFGPLNNFSRVMIVRDGATLLLCSSMPVLEGALSVIDGDRIDTVADNEVYQRSLEQVGRGNAYAVLLMEQSIDALSMNPMMMMMGGPMLAGPMEALGFRNIAAVSASFEFSDDDAVAHQQMGVLIDGQKKGLVKLFDVPAEPGQAPAFVGPDSAGYAQYTFDFGGVMNVIRDALATLPAELRAQPENALLDYGADLSAVFTSLGHDIHTVSTSTGGTLVALQVTAPDRLAGVIGKFAPMGGLEPRDFLGHTIYSEANIDISIGLGGGFLFIGPNVGVEQAMRSLGQADLPSLADDPTFERAIESLDGGAVVAWGYTNTASTINTVQQTIREGPMGMMGGPVPDMGDMPNVDLEFINRFIGPSVWQMRSTDSGFILKSTTLKPIEEE